MSMKATNTCFEIEREIRDIMPKGHMIVDAGMYVGQEGETWRDCCVEVEAEEREYGFTYSSLGNHEGDIPPKMVLNVLTILQKYQQEAAS